MPDWIAHLGFAFLLAYALKIRRAAASAFHFGDNMRVFH